VQNSIGILVKDVNIPYPTSVEKTLMESRHMLYVEITLTLASADVLDYGAFYSLIRFILFCSSNRQLQATQIHTELDS